MLDPNQYRYREYTHMHESDEEQSERLQKVLEIELSEGDYSSASLTMRWMQEINRRPRISKIVAAILMLDHKHDLDVKRMNWREVDYVD